MKKILCICFSPSFQRTISFKRFELEKVNRSTHYRLDASGKGPNSARVLAQLSPDCVKTFCPLGAEDFQSFVELSTRDNLNLSYITHPGKTRLCCTMLDSDRGTTTEMVIGEPVLNSDEQLSKLALNKISELIESTDAVLLSGSKPAMWTADMYPKISKLAIDNNKLLLADFVGQDLNETLKVCSPSVIKINDEEFTKTFGGSLEDKEALRTSITSKSKELHNMIVVTRGTDSTYAAINGKFYECPTEKVKVVNTTACGDSFNAGFLYEYLNSGDFEAALKKGTWCAARNAEKECPGTIF